MRATIQNTDRVVTVNGVPARVWVGTTESGVRFQALITRIAVEEGEDSEQFDTELRRCDAPVPELFAFPLSLIL